MQRSFLCSFICLIVLSMIDLHFTHELLHSFYSYYLLLKWFENNHFPMMLWLEPNLEVHCILFYSANVMKEGMSGSGLTNKYTMF